MFTAPEFFPSGSVLIRLPSFAGEVPPQGAEVMSHERRRVSWLMTPPSAYDADTSPASLGRKNAAVVFWPYLD